MTAQQKPFYHDAIILAKMGAMIYVVDENGNELSDGHHSVTWRGHEDFEAKTGASNYTFTVDTDRIDPWNQRLARQMTLDEVVEYAADERVAAFAAYLREYDNVPRGNRVALGDINFK